MKITVVSLVVYIVLFMKNDGTKAYQPWRGMPPGRPPMGMGQMGQMGPMGQMGQYQMSQTRQVNPGSFGASIGGGFPSSSYCK